MNALRGSLAVIGAGWSRTGTFSLREALGTLGFGPCYHMHELFQHPEHVALWRSASAGRLENWDDLLAGYGSVADSPACLFWRELVQAYPRARIILTVRDSNDWYESMRNTVCAAMLRAQRGPGAPNEPLLLSRELVLDGFFRGEFADRAAAIARFEAHNAAVQSEVPAQRLLVYEVAQGWKPLCAFLGVPEPPSPFPRTNSREAFRQRSRL